MVVGKKKKQGKDCRLYSSSALPNIKYNCVILFWSQLYWVFIYDSKYSILIDTNTKMRTEIIDLVVFRKKSLKFLQGVLRSNLFVKWRGLTSRDRIL